MSTRSDAFGQTRRSITAREVTIAALFVALLGIGVWSVAMPALSNDPKHEDDDSSASEGAANANASTDKPADPSTKTTAPSAAGTSTP